MEPLPAFRWRIFPPLARGGTEGGVPRRLGEQTANCTLVLMVSGRPKERNKQQDGHDVAGEWDEPQQRPERIQPGRDVQGETTLKSD